MKRCHDPLIVLGAGGSRMRFAEESTYMTWFVFVLLKNVAALLNRAEKHVMRL